MLPSVRAAEVVAISKHQQAEIVESEDHLTKSCILATDVLGDISHKTHSKIQNIRHD
jgi:hypothetical protein